MGSYAIPGEGKIDAVALADLVQWQEVVPGTVPTQFEHFRCRRGELLHLPPAEFDRLAALGAISRPELSAEGLQETTDAATTGPLPEGDAGDEVLRNSTAAELIAYATQNPSEQARVGRLEQERKAQRATVLKAAGLDPATGTPVDDDTDTGGDNRPSA